ncbi:radical SAM protein [bacterium]|nr:radical SAM protein [candidate division CSSED10-310 bacterium]
MRISLIRGNERPDPHTPIREANVTGIYPPLGLAYLAGSLLRAGHEVRIIDAHALNLSPAQVAAIVVERRDELAGVTSTSLNWLRTIRIIRALRAAAPAIRIVAGGPHLALFAGASMAIGELDAAICCEGEEALPELVEVYAGGGEPRAVAGVVYRNADGEVVENPPRPPITDLDATGFPVYELLPVTRYRALTIQRPFYTMITSRGCPHRCGFCSQIYAGGAFRQRSPGDVVEEMAFYVEHRGAREIILFDETFTIGERRVLEICELIRQRGLRFRWNIRARADTITAPLARALKAAGCYSIHVGIESGADEILRRMRKDISLAQAEQALAISREAGLETRGYFMLGYPGETIATMAATIACSLRLPLDWASFSITVPQPATEIMADAVRTGLMPGDYWLRYAAGDPPGPLPYFTTHEYDESALERLLYSAYRRFYGRPSTIARIVTSGRLLRTLPELAGTLRYLVRSRR